MSALGFKAKVGSLIHAKRALVIVKINGSLGAGSASDPAVGWGGGARNMKSMWPPLAAIFFMTSFYRTGRGGAMALSPPWIRYCGS